MHLSSLPSNQASSSASNISITYSINTDIDRWRAFLTHFSLHYLTYGPIPGSLYTLLLLLLLLQFYIHAACTQDGIITNSFLINTANYLSPLSNLYWYNQSLLLVFQCLPSNTWASMLTIILLHTLLPSANNITSSVYILSRITFPHYHKHQECTY